MLNGIPSSWNKSQMEVQMLIVLPSIPLAQNPLLVAVLLFASILVLTVT